MKFYDMEGNIHDTHVGAIMSDVSARINGFIQQHLDLDPDEDLPVSQSLEEVQPVTNESESVPVNPDVIYLPPKNDTIVVESETSDAVEEPATSPVVRKINIDYAHREIQLVDDNGNIVTSAPIDDRLVAGTIDKALLDVMYPDGNVPEGISMNIQSIAEDNSSSEVSDMGLNAPAEDLSGDFPMG